MTERVERPTREQSTVIQSAHRSFVVSAAAGAGKTFVLVERYLRHIESDGNDPDQILAITFTRKAAAEMKTRIVNTLRDKGLYEQAQKAETGPIQTIHSFCERLLRENSLEAGVDPKFEILGDAATTRLISECIREALSSPLEDSPHAEALLASLAGRKKFGAKGSPYAKLEEAVAEVLSRLRGAGVNPLDLQNRHLDSAGLIQSWNEAMLASAPLEVQAAFANGDDGPFHLRLQQAYKTVTNRTPSWLKGPVDEEVERISAEHTCGLVQLACVAWWRLESEMERLQKLDFTELERRGVRLLETSAVTRKRVAEQYQVVMVDESQDLNPQQYRLLVQLSPQVEMFVGDAQQSIYGFRQADRRLFLGTASERPQLELRKNHRSGDGILNLIDLLFGHLWGQEYRPMNEKSFDLDDSEPTCFEGVEIWRHQVQDTDATVSYIRELLDEGEAPRDIAILTRDGLCAADIRDYLDRSGIPSRIVGGSERFYTRLEVRDLANALRAVADPFDDFTLLSCLRSPVVGMSLDSLFQLASTPQIVEQLDTFDPPVAEDAEKLAGFLRWFVPLKGYADRLSAWEVLAEILAKSPFLTTLAMRPRADQLLANARKLLSLAIEEPELGPLEYAERVRNIQNLRHKEGDAPAGADTANEITIMTIHKAKGLEFPVVVVPQTYKKVVGNAGDLLIEPLRGLVVARYGRDASTMHKYLADVRKERETDEELRVLYVALTRAKRRLCVCVYSGARDSLSQRITSVVKGPLPGLRYRESAMAEQRG